MSYILCTERNGAKIICSSSIDNKKWYKYFRYHHIWCFAIKKTCGNHNKICWKLWRTLKNWNFMVEIECTSNPITDSDLEKSIKHCRKAPYSAEIEAKIQNRSTRESADMSTLFSMSVAEECCNSFSVVTLRKLVDNVWRVWILR